LPGPPGVGEPKAVAVGVGRRVAEPAPAIEAVPHHHPVQPLAGPPPEVRPGFPPSPPAPRPAPDPLPKTPPGPPPPSPAAWPRTPAWPLQKPPTETSVSATTPPSLS